MLNTQRLLDRILRYALCSVALYCWAIPALGDVPIGRGGTVVETGWWNGVDDNRQDLHLWLDSSATPNLPPGTKAYVIDCFSSAKINVIWHSNPDAPPGPRQYTTSGPSHTWPLNPSVGQPTANTLSPTQLKQSGATTVILTDFASGNAGPRVDGVLAYYYHYYGNAWDNSETEPGCITFLTNNLNGTNPEVKLPTIGSSAYDWVVKNSLVHELTHACERSGYHCENGNDLTSDDTCVINRNATNYFKYNLRQLHFYQRPFGNAPTWASNIYTPWHHSDELDNMMYWMQTPEWRQ